MASMQTSIKTTPTTGKIHQNPNRLHMFLPSSPDRTKRKAEEIQTRRVYPFQPRFRPARVKRKFLEADMNNVRSKGNLASLIPIAVVVVGGCEPCAEKMVKQALAQGGSWQEIDETLRILADMQKRECVIKAL